MKITARGLEMRFNSFRFENFKGIQNTKLDLELRGLRPRIFTLVGLNESGKTTILDAIDNFIPQREESDINPRTLANLALMDESDLIPIAKRANFNDDVSISANIELDDDDYEAVVRILRKKHEFNLLTMDRTINIRVSYEFEDSKFKIRQAYWRLSGMTGKKARARIIREVTPSASPELWQAAASVLQKRMPKIWYFPNFLFDFPESIHLNPAADEDITNRLYRELFQDILHANDASLDLKRHVLDRALAEEPGDHRLVDHLMLNLGRDVTNSVVSAWNKMFATREMSDKKVILKWNVEDQTDVRIEFLLEDNDGIFAIKDRSLGFRWFFVYLLLTSYRGQRKSNTSDMVFLFDEPASNLHSSAQAMLLESLEKLSQTSDIIFTTHSPHLINPKWLASTYVVENRGVADYRGASSATISTHTDIVLEKYSNFAAQYPTRRDFFQPVLDVLDYQPSQLELVPSVVMVEGKGDYQLLKYASDVLGLSDKASGPLHILPGTGAGTLTTVIQLYLGWARPFLVLLDGDAAGNRARQKYVNHFGDWIRPNILTLPEVAGDERVTAIESLLSEADRLTIAKVVAPDADGLKKKDFQAGVEYLLALRQPIDITEGSLSTLSSVLTAIDSSMDAILRG